MAWVFEGANDTGQFSGAVVVPGSAKDQSSYRSELAGIYSILAFAKRLCMLYKIMTGSIELGCNGQSALDKAFNFVDLIQIEVADHDLLQAIRTLWASSPITWTFRYVKGHQDNNKSLDSLDCWAKLIMEMDAKAKQHLEVARRTPQHYNISAEPWSLWIGGEKNITDVASTIYDVVHSREAKDYWMKKDNLPHEAMDEVDWELLNVAMKEIKRNRRVFSSKHTSGICGVGKFMQRWKLQKDNLCPRCGELEDAPHVWVCQGSGATEIWDKSLDKLEDWLKTVNTNPDIQHTIISSKLERWNNPHLFCFLPDSRPTT